MDSQARDDTRKLAACHIALALFAAGLAGLLSACGPDIPSGEWHLAFADLDQGRIATCRLDGSHLRYITPDSLFAQHPSADSTGRIVIFASTHPDDPNGPSALYRIRSDGDGLVDTRNESTMSLGDVVVRVPRARVKLHEANAPFDQPPRHEAVSSKDRGLGVIDPVELLGFQRFAG